MGYAGPGISNWLGGWHGRRCDGHRRASGRRWSKHRLGGLRGPGSLGGLGGLGGLGIERTVLPGQLVNLPGCESSDLFEGLTDRVGARGVMRFLSLPERALDGAVCLFQLGGVAGMRNPAFGVSAEFREPARHMIHDCAIGQTGVCIGEILASVRVLPGQVAQLPVGGDPIGLTGSVGRRWDGRDCHCRFGCRRRLLHRLVERGFGYAVFRGQRLQRFDGPLVERAQGLTDLTGQAEITVSFGLAGHFVEGVVRVVRLGGAGWTQPHLLRVPAELGEFSQDCLVEAINNPMIVAADVHSGDVVVVTAKFAQSAIDRVKVGLRRRRRRRTVGTPGEPGLHLLSLAPRDVGVGTNQARVLTVDG